jgi:hypothetical protein
MQHRWIAVLVLGVLASPITAAELDAAVSQQPRELQVTFADLGAAAISLRGALSTAGLDIGIRKDEVVVGAVLHLRFTYSPSLLQELSHLRVSLNGQAIEAVTLTRADAGHEVERSIPLDPSYFSDYNHIQLDLIGHYSSGCEDPDHSSIWARISGRSALSLTLRPLELRDDLALLPAPFFDQHDNRRLDLPVVLPANASRDIVRSAGLAASWFGMLADYRSARFPVTFDGLPGRHSMVFATNDSRPTTLPLPMVQAATVSVVDHPTDPSVKLLVFQGKDASQLRQAVEGMVLGNTVLTGNTATVSRVVYRRRAAYDAPRWVSAERPVRLGELMDDPQQLQGHGIAPQPMRVNLRLPPDLFVWNRSGVPVDLHYRYTSPLARDNSQLTVSINNQLLRSYRLRPQSDTGGGGRFFVPLLQNDGTRESQGLLIPAFQLASDNQMQFEFSMDQHRDAQCREVFIDNTRESIDPDSSVDISSFEHYTALPNLALFANAGFPFTRYADLAETAIVVPDFADRDALEELFFLLGRMGRQTGAPALAYRLLDVGEAQQAQDLDLLILSGTRANDLIAHWGSDLALVFGEHGRDYRQLGREPTSMPGVSRAAVGGDATANVVLQATGPLGALMSFQSRVTRGRTVVALVGSDAAAAHSLIASLEDGSKVSDIRGELAIVRNDAIQSFQGTDFYYVGSLPWRQWLWFNFSQHVLVLTLVSLAVTVSAALLAYGLLQRRMARRLQDGTRA